MHIARPWRGRRIHSANSGQEADARETMSRGGQLTWVAVASGSKSRLAR